MGLQLVNIAPWDVMVMKLGWRRRCVVDLVWLGRTDQVLVLPHHSAVVRVLLVSTALGVGRLAHHAAQDVMAIQWLFRRRHVLVLVMPANTAQVVLWPAVCACQDVMATRTARQLRRAMGHATPDDSARPVVLLHQVAVARVKSVNTAPAARQLAQTAVQGCTEIRQGC